MSFAYKELPDSFFEGNPSDGLEVGLNFGDMSPEEAQKFAYKFGLVGLMTGMTTAQIKKVLHSYPDGRTKTQLLEIIARKT